MSASRYSIIPSIAVNDIAIHGTPIMVLLVLGTKTDRHGWCQANQGKIAEALGVKRQAVNRAVKILTERGYIKKYDTRCKGQPGGICKYQVIMDRDVVDDQPVDEIPVGKTNGPSTKSEQKGSAPGQSDRGLSSETVKGCTLKDTTVVRPEGDKGVVSPGAYNTTTPINNDFTIEEKGASACFSENEFLNGDEEQEHSHGEREQEPAGVPDKASPTGRRAVARSREGSAIAETAVSDMEDLQTGSDDLDQTTGTKVCNEGYSAADLQTKLKLLAVTVGARLGSLQAHPRLSMTSVLESWLVAGADFDKDVLPAVTALAGKKKTGRINAWTYFSGAVADALALRTAGLPPVSAEAQKRISRKGRSRTGPGPQSAAEQSANAEAALAARQQQKSEIDMSQPFGERK